MHLSTFGDEDFMGKIRCICQGCHGHLHANVGTEICIEEIVAVEGHEAWRRRKKPEYWS